MANYKSYQQVINLSAPATHAGRVTKAGKQQTQPIKRRTKSGCLTCRKRKKKCDEDKVDGKCQGCTRNFLQCCWPGDKKVPLLPPSTGEPNVATSLPTPAASPLSRATVLDSEVSCVMLPARAKALPDSKPETNDAFSPKASPRLTATEETKQTKEANQKVCQFFVTSIDRNRVCDIRT